MVGWLVNWLATWLFGFTDNHSVSRYQ